MAGPVVVGRKWKPEDGPPKREDYANNQDFEAADSDYRRWRSDQKRDAQGGVQEKSIKQSGEGESQPVHGIRQIKDITAPVVVEQDPSKLVGASKDSKKPAGDEAEPKKPGPGASLSEIAAYNKAMQEMKKKKAEKAGGGKKSPYP